MKSIFKTTILFAACGLIFASCNSKKSENKEQVTQQTIAGEKTDITYSRAVEAVIWGMPAVNYDVMLQAAIRDAKSGNGQIIYWSRPCDWKNQFLTPNTDALYSMPFFSTKDVGPMVLEIPKAGEGTIVGSIMDCWQTPLEDVGPAGADAGKGGKYLILPPGYKEKVPAGYIVLPSVDNPEHTHPIIR